MNEETIFRIELTPWGRNFYGVAKEQSRGKRKCTPRKLLKNRYRRYKGYLSFKQWIVQQ